MHHCDYTLIKAKIVIVSNNLNFCIRFRNYIFDFINIKFSSNLQKRSNNFLHKKYGSLINPEFESFTPIL